MVPQKTDKGSLMQVIKGITMALSLHFRSTTLHGTHAENQKEARLSPIHAISSRLLVRRRTKERRPKHCHRKYNGALCRFSLFFFYFY